MSRFFKRVGKTRYKFQFQATIESLRIHPMHLDKDLVVALQRGTKSASTSKPRKSTDAWGDTLSLVVTLYRDKHGRYQEKAYQLVVKQAATGKPLATFKLDASHFATASGTKETTELRTQNPKEDGLVKLGIMCTFLKESTGPGSDASSIRSDVIDEEEEEDEDDDDKGSTARGRTARGSFGNNNTDTLTMNRKTVHSVAEEGDDDMEQDLSGFEEDVRSQRTDADGSSYLHARRSLDEDVSPHTPLVLGGTGTSTTDMDQSDGAAPPAAWVEKKLAELEAVKRERDQIALRIKELEEQAARLHQEREAERHVNNEKLEMALTRLQDLEADMTATMVSTSSSATSNDLAPPSSHHSAAASQQGEEAAARIAELERQLEDLTNDAEARLEALESDLQHVEEEKKAATAALEGRIRMLERELERAQYDPAAHAAKAAAPLATRVKELEAELARASEERQDLEARLKEAERARDEAGRQGGAEEGRTQEEKELERAREEAAAVGQQLQEARAQGERLAARLKQAEERLQGADKEAAGRAGELQAELERSEEEREALQARLKAAERQAQALRDDARAEQAAGKARVKELEAELQQAKQEAAEAQVVGARTMVELRELKTQARDKEQQVEELEEVKGQLEEALASLKASQAEQSVELSRAKSELWVLQANASEGEGLSAAYKAKLQELEVGRAALEARIVELEGREAASKASQARAEDQAQRARAEASEMEAALEGKVRRMEEDAIDLKARLRAADDARASAAAGLEAQGAELRRQLKEAEKRAAEEREARQALAKEAEQLKKTVEALQRQQADSHDRDSHANEQTQKQLQKACEDLRLAAEAKEASERAARLLEHKAGRLEAELARLEADLEDKRVELNRLRLSTTSRKLKLQEVCELEGSISHLAQQSSMRKRELESYRGLAEGVLSVASATDATVEKARERVKLLSTSRTLDASSSSSSSNGGGGKDVATEGELDRLHLELSRARDELAAREKADREHAHSTQKLHLRVMQVEAELQTAHQTRDKALGELRELEGKVQDLEQQMSEAKKGVLLPASSPPLSSTQKLGPPPARKTRPMKPPSSPEEEIELLREQVDVLTEELDVNKMQWAAVNDQLDMEKEAFQTELVHAKLQVAELSLELDMLRQQLRTNSNNN